MLYQAGESCVCTMVARADRKLYERLRGEGSVTWEEVASVQPRQGRQGFRRKQVLNRGGGPVCQGAGIVAKLGIDRCGQFGYRRQVALVCQSAQHLKRAHGRSGSGRCPDDVSERLCDRHGPSLARVVSGVLCHCPANGSVTLQNQTLSVIITQKLKSYGAAKREIIPGVEHRQHEGFNNQVELSY